MSGEPRFVFDSNVVISAALFAGSIPERSLRRALDHGKVLLARELILELRVVLARSKFDRYLTLEVRDLFLANLIQQCVLVTDIAPVRVCRDPRDDIYLALAVAGGAASIISGDVDLLVLRSFEGIPILSPADFLASVQLE
jgi:putative PIN family toxin of toxin-antitoxin system